MPIGPVGPRRDLLGGTMSTPALLDTTGRKRSPAPGFATTDRLLDRDDGGPAPSARPSKMEEWFFATLAQSARRAAQLPDAPVL
jgi:hypothetical protein